MNAYATKLSEGFAASAIQIYYQLSCAEEITNQDYEGEIKDEKSVLNILTFGKLSLQNYTGSNLTVNDVTESNGQLITDQQKAFYFRVKSLDKFKAWIKNPQNTLLDQVGKELKKTIDQFVLGLYTKVAAGNRIGTAYTTGSVAVDISGNVTGTSTVFTSAMVGRGFKAAGMTGWVRVASFTDATHITVQDDSDDLASAYSQGVIAGGATYTIEAATPVQVTAASVYDQVLNAAQILDDLEVPAEDRFMVIPPYMERMIKDSNTFTPYTTEAFDITKKGVVGQLGGFLIFKSTRLTGDSVNGWHVLAGHKSAITFAMGFVESGLEDLIGNFGKAYKGLNVYGAKVVDERRKALVELYLKA